MSSEYRTVDEYIALFAKSYHLPEDKAEKYSFVKNFEKYTKERDKADDNVDLSQAGLA